MDIANCWDDRIETSHQLLSLLHNDRAALILRNFTTLSGILFGPVDWSVATISTILIGEVKNESWLYVGKYSQIDSYCVFN